MRSALIVSANEKSTELLQSMLTTLDCTDISTAKNAAAARRLLTEYHYDLFVVNAPLGDETGETLAIYAAEESFCQVLLLVKSELFEEVSAIVEESGVIAVAKPVNRSVLWSALKIAKAMNRKLQAVHSKNFALAKKIEEIKLVDRAKGYLIDFRHMSEADAHKHIERRAMNLRKSKAEVAQEIIASIEGD